MRLILNEVYERTMRHRYSFRRARRTGGVDDIRQILARYFTSRVISLLFGDIVPFAIEMDHLHSFLVLPESGLRKQDLHLRISHHERESL